MKNFSTNLEVIEGEFNSKTNYLSWDMGKGKEDGWAQGEFAQVIYNGQESVIHSILNDEDEIIAYVIAPIK